MNPNLSTLTTERQPRHSNEEFAKRGDRLYNEKIRSQIEVTNPGEYVAIDIETGLWEVDSDPLIACDRLIAHKPDSQTWLVRVGYPYIHRIGETKRNLES